MARSNPFRPDTLLAHLGRPSGTTINMAVQRASTILFESLGELERSRTRRPQPGDLTYGASGTQTTHAFEAAIAELEGGYGAIAFETGLAACTTAILAFVRQGDHLLMTDSVYDPTRRFCDQMLAQMGVETTYYDPAIGEEIAGLMRPNTKLVYLESPGSHTFEVQDVPAICRVARERGAVAVLDNTWATPLYFPALAHGADVAVYAATKYIVGHSDAVVGVIVANEACYEPVRSATTILGHCLAPDDAYLSLRGLRTMGVRLERQQRSALEIARRLQAHPEVARVLHPALPDDPGHALWKRDFRGAAGVFAFVLPPSPHEALAAFLDEMELFGIGYSWGGYESLILPGMPSERRTVARWDHKRGALIRLSIGLEDVEDLLRDLEAGLERWKRAMQRHGVEP